jgi:hypothetical protein
MKISVVRGFLGAFFGGFMAVWPAATLDSAWLVLPGAFIGWLVGYHGDRVWRGLQYANKMVRKDLSSYPSKVMIAGKSAIGSSVLFIRRLGYALYNVVLALVWIIKSILGLVLLYRFGKWLAAHPYNRAYTISVIAGVVGFGLMMSVLGYLIGEFSSFHVRIVDGIVQGSVIFPEWLLGLLSSMVSLMFLLSFIASVFFVWRQLDLDNHTQKDFYTRWERYSNSPVLFPFMELARYVYAVLWAQTHIILFFVFLVLTVVVTLPFYMVVASAFNLVRYTARFSWRAIRYNRDYGVVSLAIASIVGLITYQQFHFELVNDSGFRIVASLIAAGVSGALTVLVLYSIHWGFKLSSTLRRLAFYRGETFEWVHSSKTYVLFTTWFKKKYEPVKNWLETTSEKLVPQLILANQN